MTDVNMVDGKDDLSPLLLAIEIYLDNPEDRKRIEMIQFLKKAGAELIDSLLIKMINEHVDTHQHFKPTINNLMTALGLSSFHGTYLQVLDMEQSSSDPDTITATLSNTKVKLHYYNWGCYKSLTISEIPNAKTTVIGTLDEVERYY